MSKPKYIAPQKLKSGDRVAIVSTARKIEAEKILPAKKLLKSWGLNVVLGKHLYEEDHQFAGSDSMRVGDLQAALDDPNIKAVICSRGGYGTVRLLDEIVLDKFMPNPKWVVGYSDITALHQFLQVKANCCSLHATMPVNISSDPSPEEMLSNNSLKNALFEGKLSYKLEEHPLNRKGNAEGVMMGGNLSMLYSILGSDSISDFDGAILFLEDLDEYLYHIDRMMMNVKRNGILDRINGLVVGGMTDMNDNTIPFGKSAEEIIASHVEPYSLPVYFGFPAGHQSPNLALIMGAPTRIVKGHLEIELDS